MNGTLKCFSCTSCPDPFDGMAFNVDKITCKGKLDNGTNYVCKVCTKYFQKLKTQIFFINYIFLILRKLQLGKYFISLKVLFDI